MMQFWSREGRVPSLVKWVSRMDNTERIEEYLKTVKVSHAKIVTLDGKTTSFLVYLGKKPTVIISDEAHGKVFVIKHSPNDMGSAKIVMKKIQSDLGIDCTIL